MAAEIYLLSQRKTFWRLDVFPFILAYLAGIYSAWKLIEEEVFGKLLLVGLVLFHALFYILGHWSARLRAYVEFTHIKGFSVKDVTSASHVKVYLTKKDRGTVCEICELKENVDTDVIFFHFHKKKYIFDRENKIFTRLKPKLERTIKEFTTQDPKLTTLYDENILDIPLRSFKELLKDQMMEPFSFFQFFSVSLWLLDENRFFALLTLGMLFMTSCTVVIQRIRTMLMLRAMKLQPQYVSVYRGDKWSKISSEDLRPGITNKMLNPDLK
jgi:manganese-transporting P-type ATPase